MNENKVLAGLEALAEKDRRKGVSPIVELHLLQAFRTRRQKRAFPSWAAVCSIAAAAILTVVAVQDRPRHIPGQAVNTAPATLAPAATSTARKVAMRPIMPKRTPKPIRIEAPTATEMVTDFFPLMDPAPPFDRGEILRVQVPATAMRAVGLPVGDDHLADQIQADVLVGEEGLPRAIRFVKFEMK